ncbi:MAG: hypothetical protein V4637_11455 [Pseudomonadota bacterium]
MSIELHERLYSRTMQLCRIRVVHAALVTCIAAFGAACSEAPPAALLAAHVLDAVVSYPSSAAYDARADVLLVGSYSDGSIQRVQTARGASRTAALPLDGREHVLRIRLDAKGKRIWVLASDALMVYDADTLLLSRRIPIDALTQHSSEHCLPDMALDRLGNVLISSAMQASLIHVDAQSFAVTQHDLQVDADQDKDFGFSALAFAGRDNTLYAASATTGALWKIDLVQNRATKLALSQPLYGACALREMAAVTSDARAASTVLYVAGGFRDGIKRIELAGTEPPYRVSSVHTARAPIVPTDFVEIDRKLMMVSSQLSHYPEFNGDGRPAVPFRIVAIPAAH